MAKSKPKQPLLGVSKQALAAVARAPSARRGREVLELAIRHLASPE
jgi:hypothetical protein